MKLSRWLACDQPTRFRRNAAQLAVTTQSRRSLAGQRLWPYGLSGMAAAAHLPGRARHSQQMARLARADVLSWLGCRRGGTLRRSSKRR